MEKIILLKNVFFLTFFKQKYDCIHNFLIEKESNGLRWKYWEGWLEGGGQAERCGQAEGVG